MKKIVITGRGLVTPLGNGLAVNTAALRSGKTGIVLVPEWRDMGLESWVGGLADNDPECELMDIKRKRFTSANSRMAVAAADEALREAGLTLESLKQFRVAVINGCELLITTATPALHAPVRPHRNVLPATPTTPASSLALCALVDSVPLPPPFSSDHRPAPH